MYDDRRRFLGRVGGGSLSLGVFAAVHEAFGSATRRAVRQPSFQSARDDYLLTPGIKYLNHASIGTIPRAVHEARVGYAAVCESNPWLHIWGGEWERPRARVRQQAADLLNCSVNEVAITHNTTEMFNVLAHGLPLHEPDEVLWSSLEHPGATRPFTHLSAVRGFKTRRFTFPVADATHLSVDAIVDLYAKQIRSNTRLLVLTHIDNTVGIRFPVREISGMARDRGVTYIAVDAAQSVGMVPVSATELDVDVLATSPHKWLQAPKGLGLAYIHARIHEDLRPMWVTWGFESWKGSARRYEDYGTRNLPELLSLGDAIDFQNAVGADRKQSRLVELWHHARQAVSRTPGVQWASPTEWSLGGALFSIDINDRDSNAVARDLFRQHQIVVRPFRSQGRNLLRLSPNVVNHEDEIDQLLQAVLG